MARRTYGAGTIRQRGRGFEGCISAGVSASGNRDRRYVYGKTRAEVREKLEAIKVSSPPAFGRDLSVAEHLQDWLRHVEQENRRATFSLREGTVRRHILPYVRQRNGKPLRLVDLSPSHVRILMLELERRGVGTRTREVAFNTLSTALNAAVRWERVGRNVCLAVPKPKSTAKERPILSVPDISKFFAEIRKSSYYALYMIAVMCGVREGELLALQWSAVDLERGFLLVNASLTRGADGRPIATLPKTKQSRRRVDLPESAVTALRKLNEAQRRSGYRGEWVFSDSAGGPIRRENFLRREFYPLLERAGVPKVTFHCLRHTAATRLLEGGAQLEAVSALLGHSSIKVTADTYAHLRATSVGSELAKLSEKTFAKLADQMADSKVVILADKQKTRRAKRKTGFQFVEMGGLEPPTPYMRSKCSTS